MIVIGEFISCLQSNVLVALLYTRLLYIAPKIREVNIQYFYFAYMELSVYFFILSMIEFIVFKSIVIKLISIELGFLVKHEFYFYKYNPMEQYTRYVG